MPFAHGLKLLLVCLIAASWLCAGNAAGGKPGEREPRVKDAAPGIDPKNRPHFPDDPCPDNITVDTWEQSSTFWRWTYEECAPKGAPATYAATEKDLRHFILRRDFSPGYEVFFDELTPSVCRIDLVYKKDSVKNRIAQIHAENAVSRALEYFRFNGRSPAAEGMLIMARAFTRNPRDPRIKMYAIYDTETGDILYERNDLWR